MNETQTPEQLIRNTHGRFFRVEFIKRSTGDSRVMIARTGVKRHLKGGIQSFEPTQRNLVTVFDVTKRQYRMIALEGVTAFQCGAVNYRRAL